MKNYKILVVALLMLSLVPLLSCNKNMHDPTPVFEGLSTNKALVQVYNGILNSSRNYVYLNGQPVNGATVAFGAAFPSAAYGFSVWNGDNTLLVKDTSSTTTQLPNSFLLTATAGKSYSIFLYDTITSPKRLVVENNFTYPTSYTGNVRFVNLIYSPTATPNVDLYSVNQGNILFSNIPVGGITPFISYTAGISDTWQVRQTGTTTVLATLSVTSSTISPQRSYTVAYRGSYKVAANRGVNIISNN